MLSCRPKKFIWHGTKTQVVRMDGPNQSSNGAKSYHYKAIWEGENPIDSSPKEHISNTRVYRILSKILVQSPKIIAIQKKTTKKQKKKQIQILSITNRFE